MAAAFVLAGAPGSITIAPASPSAIPSLATFYVEHRWGVRQTEDVADLLGDKAKTRLADTAQLPMRLNADSDSGADTAYGGLTALQRELLERQAREAFQERFITATERLPGQLFVASDDKSGELVGCVGVEAAVVDFSRSVVLRRTRTPLVSELKPDGSLPDGMARRATCACHLVATDRRRQGIGSALFDRAVQHAATWGFSPLLMMVHEDDADARAFYERRGCTKVLFRDDGATATRPELPGPSYSREVLGVQRVPSPMLALEHTGSFLDCTPRFSSTHYTDCRLLCPSFEIVSSLGHCPHLTQSQVRLVSL